MLDVANWLRGESSMVALAIAIVSTKAAGHFSRSADRYFAVMVCKHQKGGLRLQRSLWALREAKFGKASRRSMN